MDKANLPISNVLGDFLYFDGEYGLGKNIPYAAVIPLSNFVSSDVPSVKDSSFWSSNSENVHLTFDENLILNDINLKVAKDEETPTVICEYSNPFTKFQCTKDNGADYDIFVGYRASHSDRDMGYDYVYNLLDGTIHYIGLSREESYVSVEEEHLENGLTLSYFADKFKKGVVDNESLTISADDVLVLDTLTASEDVIIPTEDTPDFIFFVKDSLPDHYTDMFGENTWYYERSNFVSLNAFLENRQLDYIAKDEYTINELFEMYLSLNPSVDVSFDKEDIVVYDTRGEDSLLDFCIAVLYKPQCGPTGSKLYNDFIQFRDRVLVLTSNGYSSYTIRGLSGEDDQNFFHENDGKCMPIEEFLGYNDLGEMSKESYSLSDLNAIDAKINARVYEKEKAK